MRKLFIGILHVSILLFFYVRKLAENTDYKEGFFTVLVLYQISLLIFMVAGGCALITYTTYKKKGIKDLGYKYSEIIGALIKWADRLKVKSFIFTCVWLIKSTLLVVIAFNYFKEFPLFGAQLVLHFVLIILLNMQVETFIKENPHYLEFGNNQL